MKEIILNFNKQFNIETKIKANEPFHNIVVCGMGGSALTGNIIRMLLPDLKIPIFSHRDYDLPEIADKNSLIFCVSYSGNTEETISSFRKAQERKLQTIVITTGGKLKELSTSCVLIPTKAKQPRFATGYLTCAFLKVLFNSNIIKEIPTGAINPETLEKEGEKLALRLKNKIPIIYASNRFKDIARIWKIKFNENAKIMAFWNYFPELNHNEMVGLTNLKGNFHFLILKDENDNERNKKRMDLFSKIAQEKGSEVDFIPIKGNNLFERVFNSCVLSDWVTYYLALLYKTDPIPVKIVEEFKNEL